MAPKVVVHGGTGTQGGGVVRDLLAKGGFDIVVPTRKPDSEKAEALRKQGVAIVECDQHNKEQVAAAYEVSPCCACLNLSSLLKSKRVVLGSRLCFRCHQLLGAQRHGQGV
eukprot:m.4734 g.4734  ORF g.4734 m.4734 type:complete len:111 (+) comp7159_c0_seq2:149-481(+)